MVLEIKFIGIIAFQQVGIDASLLVDQRWSSSLQPQNGNVFGQEGGDLVWKTLIGTRGRSTDRNNPGTF